MDHKVQIWNVWNAPDQQVARTLTCHSAALKDVQWSSDGTSVLSCGFDQTIQLSDIESGSQLKVRACCCYFNVCIGLFISHTANSGIELCGTWKISCLISQTNFPYKTGVSGESVCECVEVSSIATTALSSWRLQGHHQALGSTNREVCLWILKSAWSSYGFGFQPWWKALCLHIWYCKTQC